MIMIILQNAVLILQCYIKEFKDFTFFFIMHIIYIVSVLTYYELTSLSYIIIKCIKNLTTVASILK